LKREEKATFGTNWEKDYKKCKWDEPSIIMSRKDYE
jgi:hypothetical protein